MSEYSFNGFTTSTEPLAEGDAALVIRKDGSIEALVKSASDDGRSVSADNSSMLMIFGLMLLSAQDELMTAAMLEATQKIQDAMKLRVVN